MLVPTSPLVVSVVPASGILKVCVEPELEMLKSVPDVPVVKDCVPEVIPFKEINPFVPQVAFPNASEVKTALAVIVPPVTLNVFVTSEVDVNVPVLIEVDVITPAAKLPLSSLLTIVLGVLVDVAEFTDDATAEIVDELTPPTLFTVGNAADPPKSFVN